jgi:RecB family exonuclease
VRDRFAVVVSPRAADRLDRACSWLEARGEVLIVAPTLDAASDLARRAVRAKGAAFGWHRMTPGMLAAELAASALADEGRAAIGGLAVEAMAARVVHALERDRRLGRWSEIVGSPGFASALAAAIVDVRGAGLGMDARGHDRLGAIAPELGAAAALFDDELARAGLADGALVRALAAERARDRSRRHRLLDLPLLLLDVAVETALDRDLLAAVVARAPAALATVPAGDDRSANALSAILSGAAPVCAAPRAGSAPRAIEALQARLFDELGPGGAADVRGAGAAAGDDDTVTILSAPGESRECIEIARRILDAAGEGIPFDEVAILLRAPEAYRPHVEEALDRSAIPAHFARGVVRPDPAGRAMLALVSCAIEGLSARRFAEYLSLGEVPDAAEGGGPPPAPAEARWSLPGDDDLLPARIAAEAQREEELDADRAGGTPAPAPPDAPVVAGTLRAPRRWERLLVEAAVIGGLDRWRRRLDGLEHELALDRAALDDPDDPALDRIARDEADLAALRAYALPLLEDLARLPVRAEWGVWLERLTALAARGLRRSERVLATLALLAPLAPVGPVDLAEVRRVLSRHLLELRRPSGAGPAGRVFVGPIDAARGRSFEVVFVPGLAEKLFPRRIAEDPILLDEARTALGAGLATRSDRVAAERLALRLAVGAARRRVVLSYPRLDLDRGSARVPSFYALESVRAAEGRLPLIEELEQRAETWAAGRRAPVDERAAARVGWPAPAAPDRAIDDAEYDLAILERLVEAPPDETLGAARYLLGANPHLGRALRARARRGLGRWTPADGLIAPSAGARAALDAHRLAARSYSPTALQTFAVCPYRFLLHAIHRLAPREDAKPIEEMDPLQRGSLVHDVQHAMLTRLRDAGLLPVREARLDGALAILDEALDAVAARYRDDLAPAIDRVWEDGIAEIRADLRQWLRLASRDESGFVPWRFELAFGLPERRVRDDHSVAAPVALDGGVTLRGSIDLVERGADGALRVTDHKTGRQRVKAGTVVDGGRMLQPVLYALAAERIFAGARVVSGRLFFCTAVGGFAEHEVALDAEAREAVRRVVLTIDGAVADGTLVPYPDDGACRWCDYQVVCGPFEEQRSRRKLRDAVKPLEDLRRLR